jgi:AcrR family transcriptional regulator
MATFNLRERKLARKIRRRAQPVRKKPGVTRRRMPPRDREQLIVAEATRYFAEYGLNGGTIELARRIGMTQPLLYKYFRTKEALIERVYERLFPGHWNPQWEELLDDTGVPLRQRIKQFYTEYARVVLTYEHVRLFLFSGLSKFDYNARYYSILTERIFLRIARALRHEFAPVRSRKPISDEELELVQSLHAAIYHIAFRKFVHYSALRFEIGKLIEMKVDFFMDGAEASMSRMFAAERPRRVQA